MFLFFNELGLSQMQKGRFSNVFQKNNHKVDSLIFCCNITSETIYMNKKINQQPCVSLSHRRDHKGGNKGENDRLIQSSSSTIFRSTQSERKSFGSPLIVALVSLLSFL